MWAGPKQTCHRELASSNINSRLSRAQIKSRILMSAAQKASTGHLSFLWQLLPEVDKATHLWIAGSLLSRDELQSPTVAQLHRSTSPTLHLLVITWPKQDPPEGWGCDSEAEQDTKRHRLSIWRGYELGASWRLYGHLSCQGTEFLMMQLALGNQPFWGPICFTGLHRAVSSSYSRISTALECVYGKVLRME